MKIISASNFDDETKDDKLIAENVPEFYVKTIVDALNDKYSGWVQASYMGALNGHH